MAIKVKSGQTAVGTEKTDPGGSGIWSHHPSVIDYWHVPPQIEPAMSHSINSTWMVACKRGC